MPRSQPAGWIGRAASGSLSARRASRAAGSANQPTRPSRSAITRAASKRENPGGRQREAMRPIPAANQNSRSDSGEFDPGPPSARARYATPTRPPSSNASKTTGGRLARQDQRIARPPVGSEGSSHRREPLEAGPRHGRSAGWPEPPQLGFRIASRDHENRGSDRNCLRYPNQEMLKRSRRVDAQARKHVRYDTELISGRPGWDHGEPIASLAQRHRSESTRSALHQRMAGQRGRGHNQALDQFFIVDPYWTGPDLDVERDENVLQARWIKALANGYPRPGGRSPMHAADRVAGVIRSNTGEEGRVLEEAVASPQVACRSLSLAGEPNREGARPDDVNAAVLEVRGRSAVAE